MSFDINTWGKNVWYLFHSLAYKIKESNFNKIKNDIIYVIKTVSTNLPCQECSLHAANELNKVQFNNINSKEELKKFLFNFHNHINKKLNKPCFEYSELDKKYSQANFNIIYNNFFIIFSSKSNIPQLMSASFHRQHNLPKIKIALDKIISNFD